MRINSIPCLVDRDSFILFTVGRLFIRSNSLIRLHNCHCTVIIVFKTFGESDAWARQFSEEIDSIQSSHLIKKHRKLLVFDFFLGDNVVFPAWVEDVDLYLGRADFLLDVIDERIY